MNVKLCGCEATKIPRAEITQANRRGATIALATWYGLELELDLQIYSSLSPCIPELCDYNRINGYGISVTSGQCLCDVFWRRHARLALGISALSIVP